MDSWFFLLFPAGYIRGVADSEEAKNLAGQKFSAVIRIRIATPSFAKISPARQANSPEVPQLQPALLRLSAMVFQDFTHSGSRLLFLAEFLKSGIAAQRVPQRIESKKGRCNSRWVNPAIKGRL